MARDLVPALAQDVVAGSNPACVVLAEGVEGGSRSGRARGCGCTGKMAREVGSGTWSIKHPPCSCGRSRESGHFFRARKAPRHPHSPPIRPFSCPGHQQPRSEPFSPMHHIRKFRRFLRAPALRQSPPHLMLASAFWNKVRRCILRLPLDVTANRRPLLLRHGLS